MSKRIAFTTVTALPPSVSRQTAVSYLHDHLSLIDLNPLVQSRHHLISPPAHAPATELRCTWYALTDRLVPGLPAPVSYTAAFQNLPNGVQVHAYAPMARDTKEWWTIGGSLPGETAENVEPGLDVPKQGLYLRHDVEVRCNVLVAGFVRKTLKKTHTALVDHIVADTSNETSKNPSSVSAFRLFADDETFLGPQHLPSSMGHNAERHEMNNTAASSDISVPEKHTRAPPTTSPPPPPTFLRTPGPVSAPTPPSAPTNSPPPPPTFLRTAKGTPCLKLSRAPSFPRMLNPKATPLIPAGSPYPPPLRIPNRQPAARVISSPGDFSPNALGSWPRSLLPAPLRSAKRHSSALPVPSPVESSPTALGSWSRDPMSPPLRNPKRHSTALAFPSPAASSPDALGSWSRDSLPPRPQSTALNRNVSVVSKYPHAAEQDYSDIAAMNPFDSDDEGSESTIDSFPDSAGGGGFFVESPLTLVEEPAAPRPALPGAIPQLHLRFEFDESESGQGLGISVPGELLEESYEALEGKLPVLEDKRSSMRPLPQMQETLNEPACYELY